MNFETFRRSRAVVVMLVAVFALAACGDEAPGEDAAADDDTNGEGETDEPTETNDEDPIELRFANGGSETSTLGVSAIWWADEVTERTNGRVTFDMFHQGTLVPTDETFHAVSDGRADVGIAGIVFMTDELRLWNRPLLFDSRDVVAVAKAFDELAEENEAFSSELEAQNLQKLFVTPLETSGIIGTSEEITSISDVEGLRLRGTPPFSDALEVAGAQTTHIPHTETYEALQRDTIDGWSGLNFTDAIDAGLHEVAPNMVSAGVGASANVATFMNSDVWESMPSDVQTIMNEVTEDYYAAITDILMENEANACDRALNEGASVGVLPQEEIDAWQEDIGDSITASWYESATQKFSESEVDAYVEDFLGLVEEFEGTTGYEEGIAICAGREG